MRKGGGGKKGSSFERRVAKALSKWVSGGKQEDLFWRSSMSGGRATVARKRGAMVRQAGDICSVAPEGHSFTNTWYVECKAYKQIDLGQWLINNNGRLAKWWKHCRKEAKHYKRDPMLIVKQNGWPILVITRRHHLEHVTAQQFHADNRWADVSLYTDMLLSNWKEGTR